uniref:Calponin-homology (CH) domain-containing protein n=1 Tax=Setaria digitata TaxID=48799 RepID=A0A915PNF4_9BILA
MRYKLQAMTTDIAVRGHDYNGRIEDYEEYDENSSARLFERSRIKALADERENVQKKTFTKWVNSHLLPVNCKIHDLYMDMRDGKMLIRLLEVLSGERLSEERGTFGLLFTQFTYKPEQEAKRRRKAGWKAEIQL